MKRLLLFGLLLSAPLFAQTPPRWNAVLTWQYQQSSDPAVTFDIFRTITGSNNWSLVGSVPISSTSFSDSTVSAGTDYTYYVAALDAGLNPSGPSNAWATGVIPGPAVNIDIETAGNGQTPGLHFYPLTPCRVVDTRNANGSLGGPELSAYTERDFTLPGTCGIPSTATVYSLNVTAVPGDSTPGYLAVWPQGLPQPAFSTLNYFGWAIANGTIVPAGTNGGVAVYANTNVNLVIDVNGYFAP